MDECEDAVAGLEERGLEPTIEAVGGAGRKASVTDPAGNLVTLVEVGGGDVRVLARPGAPPVGSVEAGGGEQVEVEHGDGARYGHQAEHDGPVRPFYGYPALRGRSQAVGVAHGSLRMN